MQKSAGPLVDTQWLEDHLNDPELRVFDVTTFLAGVPGGFEIRSGRLAYEESHVPGSSFLDIVSDLSDRDSPLMFTRPPIGQMEQVLSRAGVNKESRTVFYSGSSPMWATRAWWLFRSAGLEDTSVLDGGFEKWKQEGRPLCRRPCGYPESIFTAVPREEMWATKEEVLRSIGDGSVCTINALSADLHTGKRSLGYARVGHIKQSVNVPFADLLVPGTGQFRSGAELREHFVENGALEKARVITYCGGGISATLNGFALHLLKHPDVAVYDGGLDEWSRDEALPMGTET
jgi:thiosulfate/3-mercaptopyruvate sulfurtransferase